jgi:hypothetical protein
MLFAQVLAQETNLPDGDGAQILFWLIGAGVILGLWFVVARTRKRSYNEYWERKRREQQLRDNDPDMAHPDTEQPGPDEAADR